MWEQNSTPSRGAWDSRANFESRVWLMRLSFDEIFCPFEGSMPWEPTVGSVVITKCQKKQIGLPPYILSLENIKKEKDKKKTKERREEEERSRNFSSLYAVSLLYWFLERMRSLSI